MQISSNRTGVPESEFRFLAYTEDLHIGPKLSDTSILLEATINRLILDFMSEDDVVMEFIKFTKLMYYRYPRLSNHFRVLKKQIAIVSTQPRLILIAKHK